MDDEPAVRIANNATDAPEEFDALAEAEAPFAAVRVNRLPVHELHHDERDAVLGRAAVDQPRDVRMLECGKDPTFRKEAFAEQAVGETAARELERGALRKAGVGALDEIDRSHAAAAEQPDDPPAADPSAGDGGRRPVHDVAEGGIAAGNTEGRGFEPVSRRRPSTRGAIRPLRGGLRLCRRP